MISNRRKVPRRSDTEEIAELERERHRLLQQRANHGLAGLVRTSGQVAVRRSYRFHHRAQRHSDQRNDDTPFEQPHQMDVIAEIHDELSSNRVQQRKSIQLEKILMLKKVIEQMLSAADCSQGAPKTNRAVRPGAQTLTRQRNSSLANLHELNIISNPHPRHYRQHKYIHKQLEEIEEIENKVFKEILSLRDEKLQLMRDLNEETKRANQATREMKRLERELAKRANHHTIPHRTEESDNDSIINKLPREEAAYLKQDPNLRRNVADISTKEKQRILELQENVLQLQDHLRAANAHIEQLQNRLAHIDPNSKFFQEQMHRLEAKLRQAEAKNAQIQSEFGSDYTQLQQELKQLKADNEQLRVQSIEILQMPDRKFTYQKEIAHMKHEIEKENDAKAKLARDIRDFQRQFQMMEEENMRLRKRVTELEARAAIPELSREQSEKQEGTQGQLNQASNSQQFVPQHEQQPLSPNTKAKAEAKARMAEYMQLLSSS